MESGRLPAKIYKYNQDVFHLAPIPLLMREIEVPDKEAWHAQLIEDARNSFDEHILEAPDVRHIESLGKPPNFVDDCWSERQIAPVGVWHRVPTNQYLSLETAAIRRLRTVIEDAYKCALATSGEPLPEIAHISESWIQFYKNGDYKVLHNHERYGPPYPSDRWVGSYYIDHGNPDPNMPYAGVLSFRIRNENHLIRPHSGLLLMWPADVLHEVHPFYGSRDRVVVNCNINSSKIAW